MSNVNSRDKTTSSVVGEQRLTNRSVFITGVAGFIGSNLADKLLSDGYVVYGVDNLSRGSLANLAESFRNESFHFLQCDLSVGVGFNSDLMSWLSEAEIDEAWLLAANSDIPAGVSDPKVDYLNTFMTTFNTVDLLKKIGVRRCLFASTSAVYGESNDVLTETFGPLMPISNYGAMKLASEGLISASSEAFIEQCYIFRFPNVMGPRLTHGVVFDFMHKLKLNGAQLTVLGDGNQRKPYIYVDDLIDAMIFIKTRATQRRNIFNIGPLDEGASVREIAELLVAAVSPEAQIIYTGGDRGWPGDVPCFKYSVQRLVELGWVARNDSVEVVKKTISAMLGKV